MSRLAALELYMTTPDRRLLLAPVSPASLSPSGPIPILEWETRPRQTMLGYGAALTDSSAWLIAHGVADDARERLLNDLFGMEGGIGLSVLRVPMGASDFSTVGSYTYNDIPLYQRDDELKRFTLEHDRRYILPLLRQIRAINPHLTIIASPWTAPAWMKTTRHLHGGWLEPTAYSAYARYFIRFLEEYEKAGVPVSYVTIQNEPRHETTSYPSMRMEPGDQASFVREHLGPALERAGMKTKILIWDHNWDAPEYPLEVLRDGGARHFIAGTAFHAYAGEPSAQARVRDAFPDKEIHFTESSGGLWARDFGANIRWDITNLLAGAVRYGAKSVLKWNLALDEAHGPQNGGCKDCRGLITIERKTGKVTRNEEYYAFGHSSRFVRPGAVHLSSSAIPGLVHAVFRNTDGRYCVIGCNTAAQEVVFSLKAAQAAPVRIPAGAAFTLVWR